MLNKLWDDVAGGSPPDKGMKQLRKKSLANSGHFPGVPADTARIMERRFGTEEYQRPSQNIAIKKPQGITMLNVDSLSGTPSSLGSTPPTSPSMASPSTYSKGKNNIWHSVFHPGQNELMHTIGLDKFDKAQENSPTAYDWVMITALEG